MGCGALWIHWFFSVALITFRVSFVMTSFVRVTKVILSYSAAKVDGV